MKHIGIYKIRNVTNQKFYVGSSNDTKDRFRKHRNLLRKNKHHCKHLQAAWNKYGEECFRFEVIEDIVEEGGLFEAENAWLQEWVGKPECYNSGRSAEAPMRGMPKEMTPNWGKVMSSEARAKISATLTAVYAADPESHPRLGKTHTPETLAKIVANRTPPTGEAHYRFGQTVSEEVRKKIGDAQRGKPKAPGRQISPEGMSKIRAAAEAGHYASFKGKQHSEEAKAKMRKPVHAVLPDRSERIFSGLTEIRDTMGVAIATTIRACKSGKPIAFGAMAGWVLAYQGETINAPEIPEEFLTYPRSRAQAKVEETKFYFTGLPCEHGHIALRKTKGTCVECAKIEGQQSNERRRLVKSNQHVI
jgi:group I intron endonuclease